MQIIPTLSAGGLERVATSLTLRLAADGDDVVVCTRGATTHLVFRDELVAAGIPMEHIARPRPRPDHLLRSAVGIARVLRARRPDVIHAHNPAAAAAATLARVFSGRRAIPIVTTFHGLVVGDARWAAALLRPAGGIVVGVSPAATRELVHAGLSEAATVLNGVDAVPVRTRTAIRRELGIGDEDELVVSVGRYRAEKNQALLLRAAELLTAERPRLRVLIVGIGELEDELRSQIAAHGLGEVAQLTGLRADAVDVAAAADVATLTSRREALGLTLIEAMAVGTPVIGTAVGGIPNVVDDGRTGLLIPDGDHVALARAIARLLDDRALALRLATAARKDVALRFSVEAMTAAYRAVYRRAIEERTRPTARRAGARPSK
ncbi:MAG: glycosyltransferase [Actinomycetota bacterium]